MAVKRSKKWTALLIALAIIALLLPGGSAVAYFRNRLEEERGIRTAFRDAGKRYGIPPLVMEAIPKVESAYRMSAINKSGADGKRGGAYGPSQITERTARAHGYQGPMEDFNRLPALAAEWTARILAARPGGPPQNVEDAAAWWNAGKTSASKLPAGHKTLTDYIPKAKTALAYVTANALPA